MSWEYNGNKNAFSNIVDLGNLSVAGQSTLNTLRVNGQAAFEGITGIVNEQWLTTTRPDTPPGPSGPRLTPNIQFQPRTLLSCLPLTGTDALSCVVLPVGLVRITGGISCPQAARANGSIIADLKNTTLEQRLWPAYNHRFSLDGQGITGSLNRPVLVLTPGGQFVLLNADNTTAGNLSYIFTGTWVVGNVGATNPAEYATYYYGNGGY